MYAEHLPNNSAHTKLWGDSKDKDVAWPSFLLRDLAYKSCVLELGLINHFCIQPWEPRKAVG